MTKYKSVRAKRSANFAGARHGKAAGGAVVSFAELLDRQAGTSAPAAASPAPRHSVRRGLQVAAALALISAANWTLTRAAASPPVQPWAASAVTLPSLAPSGGATTPAGSPTASRTAAPTPTPTATPSATSSATTAAPSASPSADTASPGRTAESTSAAPSPAPASSANTPPRSPAPAAPAAPEPAPQTPSHAAPAPAAPPAQEPDYDTTASLSVWAEGTTIWVRSTIVSNSPTISATAYINGAALELVSGALGGGTFTASGAFAPGEYTVTVRVGDGRTFADSRAMKVTVSG